MKSHLLFSLCGVLILASCISNNEKKEETVINLKGTWKLVSGTTVDKGKSTFTDYSTSQSMIKIINDTHFAFLKHDLKPGKDGKNNFDAGGGKYILKGSQYTESLDYYNDNNWEGKSFTFKVEIHNDTLIQTGIEKVEKAGIDRSITERYVKVNSITTPL